MQHDNIINTVAAHGRDWFDALTLIVGGIGLFILIRYTGHAKRQWKATEKANENLRESMELSHRAWVVCRIVAPESLPIASGKTVMTEIENTGGSPAMNVVLRYGWMFTQNADVPDQFPESDSDIIEPVGVLGNGHSIMTRTDIPQIETPQEFIGGSRLLLVYGRIDYIDIFGKQRWTTYCKRYNNVGWTATAKHNEAD